MAASSSGSSNRPPSRGAPSQHIPNFVGQYYETSTFHHLSSWKLQYQRLVSQLNRETGPEFQPDSSTDTSSDSGQSNAHCLGCNRSNSSSLSIESIAAARIGQQGNSKCDSSMDVSTDSSSIPSEDMAPSQLAHEECGGTVYLHLDMDAFYANVLINRRYPEYKDVPVAVIPAKSSNNGTSEVACANYLARQYGIRARMFVSEARKKCPNLTILTVDYSLIEDTSARMYEQILRYTHTVEAVSADEAYLDISAWGFQRAASLAQRLKNDVELATHCPCSIGVGANKLIARLSNKKAKPAGIVITTRQQGAEFVKRFEVTELPSIGPSIASKLLQKGIKIVSDLLPFAKQTLQSWFGEKTGTRMYELARGIDVRPLLTEQDRKSVGAQISWGVRMVNQEQVDAFLSDLTAEVVKRMTDIQMIGSHVTLRVLKKRDMEEIEGKATMRVIDAKMGGYSEELAQAVPKGESAKTFNPGACTQLSRSGTLAYHTADVKIITTEILRLYKLIGLQPTELRGAGISIDDLEPADSKTKKNSTIHAFFKPKGASNATKPSEEPTPEPTEEPKSLLEAPTKLAESSTGKRSYDMITPEESTSSMKVDKPITSTATPAPKKIAPPAKKQPTILSMFAAVKKTS